MTVEFQQNAIGVRIEIEFIDETKAPLDLTSAQAISIRFSTPGGGSKEVTGLVIVNPPGNGKGHDHLGVQVLDHSPHGSFLIEGSEPISVTNPSHS